MRILSDAISSIEYLKRWLWLLNGPLLTCLRACQAFAWLMVCGCGGKHHGSTVQEGELLVFPEMRMDVTFTFP